MSAPGDRAGPGPSARLRARRSRGPGPGPGRGRRAMTAPRIRVAPPRIALTPDEAAAALGVGRTTFDTAIRPDLKLIRVGRTVLVPVAQLEKWATENAES